MSKQIHFPLRFKCPNCKSDMPVLNIVAEEEKKRGIVDKELIIGLDRFQFIFADDKKLGSGELDGKQVRGLKIYTDICGNCGTKYINLVTINEIDVPRSEKNKAQIFTPGMIKFDKPPGFIPKAN